jgi:hypothetical protein
MIQGRWVVGAVLLAGAGFCAGGSLSAETIVGGFVGAAGYRYIADADFADTAMLDDGLRASAFAMRIPGIDGGGVIGGLGVDDAHPAEAQLEAALSLLDFASNSAGESHGESLGMSGGSTVAHPAPTPPSLVDLRSVSSRGPIDLIDDVIAVPAGANNPTPSSAVGDDVLVEDAVPVLAVLGLVAAGLLLVEYLRRHRRAALARRVKRSFDRRPRPLHR